MAAFYYGDEIKGLGLTKTKLRSKLRIVLKIGGCYEKKSIQTA